MQNIEILNRADFCRLCSVILHSRIWCYPVFLKDVSDIWVDLFHFEPRLVDVATLS